MADEKRQCSRCGVWAEIMKSSEIYFETDWGGYGPKVLCEDCDHGLQAYLEGAKLFKDVKLKP